MKNTQHLNTPELNAWISKQMEEKGVPGLTLAVVQGTEVSYAEGFGVTAHESGAAVTPKTLFRIGSVAKVLTSTVVMMLAEEGVIDLDLPIVRYVPWLTFSVPEYAEQITMRSLLSHAAGLASGFERHGSRDPEGLEKFARDIVPTLPFYFPPGTSGLYSNHGLSLAGFVAQEVTGKQFDELMKEKLFAPLEMERTTYDPMVAMTYPLALTHMRKHTYVTYHHPEGGGYSNVLDLARFAQLHLGHTELLRSESVQEIHRLHADYYTTDGAGYGLAFELEPYKGLRKVWKDGLLDGYGCWIWLVPERDTAIVMMASCAGGFFGNANEICNRILDELFELPAEEHKPQAVDPDREAWSNYTGAYAGPWTGLAVVGEEGDQLVLDLNGEKLPLQAQAPGRYFVEKEDGETLYAGFFPGYAMINSIPCAHFCAEAPQVEPLQFERFAGTYDLNGSRISFRADEDGVRLVRAWRKEEEPLCTLIDEKRCYEGGEMFEFILGEDGQVSGVLENQTFFYRALA